LGSLCGILVVAAGVLVDIMEECDICGRKSENLYLVELEGAQMVACAECSKGTKVIEQLSTSKKVEIAKRPQKAVEEYQVIENYGRTIKRARDAMGIPIKVLAEKISEKESTLLRVENEDRLPDDKLSRKLEKELGIRLIIKEEKISAPHMSAKAAPLTLGDAALLKDDKKKGA
jgi:putative transcription factor